jgi:hypothetical protein
VVPVFGSARNDVRDSVGSRRQDGGGHVGPGPLDLRVSSERAVGGSGSELAVKLQDHRNVTSDFAGVAAAVGATGSPHFDDP